MIPVAANDVAFSTHAVLITLIVLFQILIYDVSGLLFLTEFISSFILEVELYLSNLVGEWSIEFDLSWWFSTAWKSKGFQDSYCNCHCCVVICCCLFFHSFTKTFLALANLHFQVRCSLYGFVCTLNFNLLWMATMAYNLTDYFSTPLLQ